MMKYLSTLLLLQGYFQLQAQNWIGRKDFIDLYNKSDIVVIGTIAAIQEYKKDTTKISMFYMPLKSLAIKGYQSIKGNFSDARIFYTDFFNGCNYAPILVENVVDSTTLFFLKLTNDTLFQIGSMNEAYQEIAASLTHYNRIKSSTDVKEWTDWFFSSSQNSNLLYLLNYNIDYDSPGFGQALKYVQFNMTQRNWFYDKLESVGEFNYDNKGIVRMLLKYGDKRLIEIMKGFMVNLQNEPYSDVDILMEGIASVTNNKELKSILRSFKNDWRETHRKRMIKQFIAKI